MTTAPALRSRASALRAATPARARGAVVPPLRLVRPRQTVAPRSQFIALVLGVLAAGLMGLLLLNMLSAQDSFRLHDLQRQAQALGDQEQALAHSVDDLTDPALLAAKARALGMVPGVDPIFLTQDARVLGQRPRHEPIPDASSAVDGLIVTGTAHPHRITPAPTASASPSPSSSPSTAAKPAPRPTAGTKPKPSATPTPGTGSP